MSCCKCFEITWRQLVNHVSDQLSVTGGGSASPATVRFPGAYSASDPGILVNVHGALATYVAPGPSVYAGGSTKSAGAACAGVEAGTATGAPYTPTGGVVTTPTGGSGGGSSGGGSGCSVAKYAQCGGDTYTGCTVCAVCFILLLLLPRKCRVSILSSHLMNAR